MDWPRIEAHPFYNHKEYYRVLQKLSFAVSYEDGNCQIQELTGGTGNVGPVAASAAANSKLKPIADNSLNLD